MARDIEETDNVTTTVYSDFQWRNLKEKITENELEIKQEMHDIDSYGRAKSSQQLASTTTERMSTFGSLYPEDNQASFTKIEVDEIDLKQELMEYERRITDTIYRSSLNIASVKSKAELDPVIKLQRIATFEKYFVCNICHDIFPSSFKQIQHAKIHSKIKRTGKTNVEHALTTSIKKTISVGKVHECDMCDYASIKLRNLKAHKFSHCNEKPFKCNECSRSFINSYVLNVHKMMHSGEKPFKCDKCDFACTRLFNLKTHKVRHSNEKSFKCDECSREFKYSSHFKMHKMIHSGEKPLKCDKCDYVCRQYNSLKTHKLSIHSNEKPFKCHECGRRFIHSNNLKVHKLIHSGEKPYNCDKCDFVCRHYTRFKIHKLSHSNEKPIK